MRLSADLLLTFLFAALAGLFTAFSYMRWVDIGFFVGPLRFSHWIAIIGSIAIAVAIPAFAALKRSRPTKIIGLYRFHILGNILFFTLISMHFASQISRSAAFYPDLGTGIAMYVAMSLQLASGFTQRFAVKGLNLKANRFIHVSLVMVFYFVIVFHTLHGLNII